MDKTSLCWKEPVISIIRMIPVIGALTEAEKKAAIDMTMILGVKERVKKSQSDHDIADNAAGERSDDKHRQKEAAGDAAAVAEHCKDEFTCQQQQ